MQHLNLNAVGRQAAARCLGDGERDLPQIVRAPHGTNHIDLVEHERDETLIARIGLIFFGEHRNRPTALTVNDRFVVPVGALDEANSEGLPPALGPSDELLHVPLGVPEVGLQRDARIGVGSKFVLQQQPSHNPDRQVLAGIPLHVEGDAHRQARGEPQERAQPSRDGGIASIWIDRIELRIQRRQFDRNLSARQASQVIGFQGWSAGPTCCRIRQRGDRFLIAGGIGIGLPFRDDRLSQQIDRMSQLAFPQFADGENRVRHPRAGNELVGHLERLIVNGVGADAGAEADGRERPHAPSHQGAAPGSGQAGFPEVLFDKGFDLGRIFEGRQNVDETKELDLEGLVADRPLKEPPGPPGAVEQAGRRSGGRGVESFGVPPNIRFGGDLRHGSIIYGFPARPSDLEFFADGTLDFASWRRFRFSRFAASNRRSPSSSLRGFFVCARSRRRWAC